MKSQPLSLTYEIELQPGETLTLPPEIATSIGAGSWIITIQPASGPASETMPTRSHNAFLRSYAAEDEGLYDDYTR